MYDPFFQQSRPYNKVIYKVLFSDEVLKNQGKLQIFAQAGPEKQLGYEMKLPPTSYEQYKKLTKDQRSGSAGQ